MVKINDSTITEVMPIIGIKAFSVLCAMAVSTNENGEYRLNKEELRRITGLGRDTLDTAIKSLLKHDIITHKYLRKVRFRNEKGQFEKNVYQIRSTYLSNNTNRHIFGTQETLDLHLKCIEYLENEYFAEWMQMTRNYDFELTIEERKHEVQRCLFYLQSDKVETFRAILDCPKLIVSHLGSWMNMKVTHSNILGIRQSNRKHESEAFEKTVDAHSVYKKILSVIKEKDFITAWTTAKTGYRSTKEVAQKEILNCLLFLEKKNRHKTLQNIYECPSGEEFVLQLSIHYLKEWVSERGENSLRLQNNQRNYADNKGLEIKIHR